MNTPTKSIEVVQNLVLDTIQPFIERLDAMQEMVVALSQIVAAGKDEPVQAPTEVEALTPVEVVGLQAQIDAVVALHALDVSPAQWQMVAGKQEAAPEGTWDVRCRICTDHRTSWRQGQPDPRRCKTVEMLTS